MTSCHVQVFEVTKVHHERGWLRQTRWLIITEDLVMKAHISNLPLDAIIADPTLAQPTKVHSISTLTQSVLFSNQKFSLQFRGDHPYFYQCENALHIVRILNERFAIHVAAQTLSPQRPEMALRGFREGSLRVPLEQDASRLCAQKLDLMQLIRAGGMDNSEQVGLIASKFRDLNATMHSCQSNSEASLAFLRQFRRELTDIRAMLEEQTIHRQRSFLSKLHGRAERTKMPKFENREDARLCLEEAIEALVFDREVFNVLWMHTVTVAEEPRRRFDENCVLMNRQPLSFFGIHDDFRAVKFDLVVEHLLALDKCTTPVGMLNSVFSALKSILTCVEAHHLNTTAKENEYSTDDILPVLIYIIVRAKSRNFSAVKTFVTEIGDPSEQTERSYFFTVFASAIQFVETWVGDTPMENAAILQPAISFHSPFATPRLLREMSPESLPLLNAESPP